MVILRRLAAWQPPRRWINGTIALVLLASVAVAAWGVASPLDLPHIPIGDRPLSVPTKHLSARTPDSRDYAPIWRFEQAPATASAPEPAPPPVEPVIETTPRPAVTLIGIARDPDASFAFVRTGDELQVKREHDAIGDCEIVAILENRVRLRNGAGEWDVSLPSWENEF